MAINHLHSSSDVLLRRVWHNLFSLPEQTTGQAEDEMKPENGTKQGLRG
jgi:hypothetical protein